MRRKLWRWRPQKNCLHLDRRCIHGDEIIEKGYNRAQCRQCGKLLPYLPALCTLTGERHPHELWG